MSEWREYQLRDLGKIVTGKTPPTKHRQNYDGDIPFICIPDLGKSRYIFNTSKTISNVGLETVKNCRLPKGSVVVSCIATIGQVGITTEEISITNQQINSVIPDKYQITSDFCYYYFKNMGEDLAQFGGGGSIFEIISKEKFSNIVLTIPPLPEQQSIASILSSLDDKIDLLHRQNTTLEKMAETLFRQWFVEEAQEDWEVVPLEVLGKIICGKTPSKKISKYFNGDIPFIKIPDMHGMTFVFDCEDSLSKAGINSQLNKTIPPKSICVSCIATVGLVVMNAKISQTNQQINSIVPDKDIYRYFIYLKMLTIKDDLLAMASGGTATDNLNTGNFSKIPIQVPDDYKLQAFHKTVEPFFDKIYINQTQIRILTALRDTLLPKLMSGEVRVG
ncbi:MAG: restriction endonuclease subunit S [Bacteroidales bacterium]|nr:restriction endonuclease subunit S [Bacteroidales bacterium]